MARFSLPYPEAWITKVVQAAVIWQASEINIQQTRLTTSIELCPLEKKNIPTESQLVATLLGQTAAGTIPVSKICLALRTLVQMEDYSFILTLNTGRTGVQPIYAGHEAQSLPRIARMRMARKESPGLKLTVIHLRQGEHILGRLLYRFSPWFRRHRVIAAELRRSATVCPLPIRLNGRLQNRLLQSSTYGFSRSERPLVFFGIRVSDEPLLKVGVNSVAEHNIFLQDPQKRQSSGGKRGDSSKGGPSSAWLLLRGPEPGRHVLGKGGPEDHEIHWLGDGVVVQRESFPCSTRLLKLTLFLNADGLKTDITGFSLNESKKKTARWLDHLSLFKAELEKLSRQSEDFFAESHQDWQTPRLSWEQKREWAEMVTQDLAHLSALEEPVITKLDPAFGRERASSSDDGPTVLRSGKYTSELIKSKNGRSQLTISITPASPEVEQ